ncbi:hypothetical protein, partial [Escherichia coli]|uniref:hypothetical protein n=1 Tax=Escherichia coli TaxID=562 RepID=UPI001F0460B3
TGSSWGLSEEGNSSFPSRHCCRHLNNRLALMPFSRASFEMDIVTNGAIVIHTQRLKSDPGGNLLS